MRLADVLLLLVAVACAVGEAPGGSGPGGASDDEWVVEDVDPPECEAQSAGECANGDVPSRRQFVLAFGSCLHQSKPAPALDAAVASAPDVFVFLGDNLYNDVDRWDMLCTPGSCRAPLRGAMIWVMWRAFYLMPNALKMRLATGVARAHNAHASAADMVALRANYRLLGIKPEVRRVREAVPEVAATWDDHDYGRNDNGASYAYKDEARELFLSFWRGGEGAVDARAGEPGVYEARTFGSGASRVQLLLLDLRSFRADLVHAADRNGSDPACALPDDEGGFLEYCAHAPDSDATLLGEAQWAWLERQLADPAAVRIVASSMAFGSQFHGMEAWSLFPAERARFVELVKRTRAEGVLVISGDVHYAELSALGATRAKGADRAGSPAYPLYDLTSSGLTQTWPLTPANAHRLAGPITRNNWGRVTVDWASGSVDLDVLDSHGTLVLHRTVRLEELKHRDQR